MNFEIEIAGRKIGPDHSPYVICELSGNHNGSLERALSMIDAAADTGCDAIKLQTYTQDTLTIDCDNPDFRIQGGLWDGRTLYDLYTEAHTPFEWHEPLFKRAAQRDVTIFSSPFDETATDLLEDLGAPAYKVASFEIVDLPLIAYIAQKGKPMIISTGLANMAEIEAAVRTARENGCQELALLHCISSYPAPSDQSNLRTMKHLADTFGVVPGLSDHTHGTATSVASIALGGAIVEKHFTLSRELKGPDSEFSLEPLEFKALCQDCHNAWRSLGRIHYDVKGAEQGNIVFRRSIYVTNDITPGEILSKQNIRSIRPGYGLPSKHMPQVLGRTATKTVKRGTALTWDMFE